jgi:hypothetical protein
VRAAGLPRGHTRRLDYHIFRRSNDALEPVSDVFYKLEDMHYFELLATLFAGVCVSAATVEYVRYPGNSYDRQYAKFCRPYGAWYYDVPAEERLRLALGVAIVQDHLERLRAVVVGRLGALLPA